MYECKEIEYISNLRKVHYIMKMLHLKDQNHNINARTHMLLTGKDVYIPHNIDDRSNLDIIINFYLVLVNVRVIMYAF